MRVELLRGGVLICNFFLMLGTMSKTERKAFYLAIFSGCVWAPAGGVNCARFPVPYVDGGNVRLGGAGPDSCGRCQLCLQWFFEWNQVPRGSAQSEGCAGQPAAVTCCSGSTLVSNPPAVLRPRLRRSLKFVLSPHFIGLSL